MDFEPGTQVTPAVRLVRPLGRGGMGAVWVAEHQTLKTEVVVKFMSDALAADPVSLARFSHEASAAAAVKSPHVVQMFDHGFSADGTPFIVMELLDGEDLRKRLQRDHVVPLGELALIVAQACKALGRAHASGIVHRDVKPDNIFLCHTDDGEPFVKLLDFGIAKSAGPAEFHVTQTGITVGTPFYMSPEQALGSPPIDPSTDLWSLGVVAFEAMTGTRPFDGATIGALTIAICNERPPVPSEVNPSIPRQVDAWLARACARDRADRFPTAKAMSDALHEALREAGSPRSIPLEFEETSLSRGSDRPPLPRAQLRQSGRAAPSASTAGSSLPAETSGGLATTTTALSRTTEQPTLAATPFAPVQTPLAAPAPARRSVSVKAAAGLVFVVGAAALVFALRDAGLPPPPAAASLASTAPLAPTIAAPRVPVASPSVSPAPPVSATASALLDSAPAKPPALHPSSITSHVSPSTTSASPRLAASAHPPSLPPPAAVAPPTHACDPPFYFDSANNKVFKKECL